MEEIKRCQNCGKPVIDKFAFCPFCGEKLAKRCKNCGEPLVEGALFCAKCGTRIEEPLVEVQDTAILRKDEELPVVPCKEAKKNVKKKKHSLNAVLTLVKRATVAFVCVFLFALSFVGVLNINVGSAASGILGSVDDDLIEGDVSIYAVDCIGLAFATARHYDEDKDIAKIEKLQDELNDIQEDLVQSVEDDVRGTRIVLSKKSENLLRRFAVKTLEYQLSIDNEKSTGGLRAEIILAGILFFGKHIVYVCYVNSRFRCVCDLSERLFGRAGGR